MSFEAILYNRMNTAAGSYMDGSFKGVTNALASCSEDIGVDTQTSQELLNISARSRCSTRTKKKSRFSRLFAGKSRQPESEFPAFVFDKASEERNV